MDRVFDFLLYLYAVIPMGMVIFYFWKVDKFKKDKIDSESWEAEQKGILRRAAYIYADECEQMLSDFLPKCLKAFRGSNAREITKLSNEYRDKIENRAKNHKTDLNNYLGRDTMKRVADFPSWMLKEYDNQIDRISIFYSHHVKQICEMLGEEIQERKENWI